MADPPTPDPDEPDLYDVFEVERPPDQEAYRQALREHLRASEFREADKELVAKLIERLKEKWGESRPCPYCGNDHYSVGSEILYLSRLRSPALVPVFSVICTNCGQTVFIDADKVGLWPRGGTEQESSGE